MDKQGHKNQHHDKRQLNLSVSVQEMGEQNRLQIRAQGFPSVQIRGKLKTQ